MTQKSRDNPAPFVGKDQPDIILGRKTPVCVPIPKVFSDYSGVATPERMYPAARLLPVLK